MCGVRSGFRVQGSGFRVWGLRSRDARARREGALGNRDWGKACKVEVVRCRTNFAHVRQSRPDYGLGFQ